MRNMMIVIGLVLALQGCAATGPNRTLLGAQAMQQGNYSTAEASMRAAIQSGERPADNWFHLGLLYYVQAGQAPATRDAMLLRSQSAFTLAARYGNPKAQDILQQWGKPVPAADLMVQEHGDQSAALALLMVGASAAITAKSAAPAPMQFAPAQLQVNCTSMAFGKIVNTDCR